MEHVKRVFLDSVVMNKISKVMTDDEVKDQIEMYIDEGYHFVTTETALDIVLFQNDWVWFENRLKDREMSIELWNLKEEMIKKPFFWMSVECETENNIENVSFENFIRKNIPEKCEVMFDLLETIRYFAIRKGNWQLGKEFSITNMPKHLLNAFCFRDNPYSATRSECFLMGRYCSMMAEFEEFNEWYVNGIAEQHNCGNILSTDCRIIKL